MPATRRMIGSLHCVSGQPSCPTDRQRLHAAGDGRIHRRRERRPTSVGTAMPSVSSCGRCVPDQPVDVALEVHARRPCHPGRLAIYRNATRCSRRLAIQPSHTVRRDPSSKPLRRDSSRMMPGRRPTRRAVSPAANCWVSMRLGLVEGDLLDRHRDIRVRLLEVVDHGLEGLALRPGPVRHHTQVARSPRWEPR